MRYLSLFSGIEAATVAWKSLGWECVAVAEIAPFPCAVLTHHYPKVPNLGDVTAVSEEQIAALGQIDLIVFGSPCQDLSVAGKRKGLLDANGNATRSGLFFTAINIIRWARRHCGARWALWENVPGTFSSNGGRDFAAVVEWLAGLDDVAVPANGWGSEGVALGEHGLVEWCVLDAQWFGVAPRRRRVFAVADFGDWRNRPPLLLERNSLRRDTAPSREAGQEVAGTLTRCAFSGGAGGRPDGAIHGHFQPVICMAHGQGGAEIATERSPTLTCNHEAPIAFQPVLEVHGTQDPDVRVEHAHTLGRNNGQENAVAYGIPGNWIGRSPENGGNSVEPMLNVAPCRTRTDRHGVAYGMAVRRLAPTECERLQGFPDGYTQVPFRNKPAADGPRYKALGNSMAVPVMCWIGEQIDAVEVFQ